MPELPEVTLYLHALRPRILGQRIERVRIASPSLLKTFDPTRETNYCPACQTGGRLLADRALSRLLGRDWPRSAEELEELRRAPESAS